MQSSQKYPSQISLSLSRQSLRLLNVDALKGKITTQKLLSLSPSRPGAT